VVGLAKLRESLERVLTDDLEHPEPRLTVRSLALSHETLVDERGEPFEHRAVATADGLRGWKRPAAGEHAELREEMLRLRFEEGVAPVERHAECLLMARRVPSPTGEQLQPVAQPRKQSRRR